ncbi:MAG: serine hydrolase [Abitibacteriaceae bacterium]|nr:serine hydrolase [Abditibacteriaceae bacterium]
MVSARIYLHCLLCLALWMLPSYALAADTPPLPVRALQDAGINVERLGVADTLVADAVAKGGVPGAVLLVAHNGSVVLRKAYGFAALRPQTRPMNLDTVFDLASLTKVVATTTALGQLLEAKKLDLEDPVARYLPTFEQAGGDKAKITIRDLMTHASGLPAGGPYAGKHLTTTQIIAEIAQRKQISPPGERFLYSDFSYITLGAVVETLTGQTLDRYCHDTIFAPLGMNDTGFLPGPELVARCAATTAGDDTPENRGKVHDPTAAALGGVAGNAGLFSTADDLARFCQMLLNGGEYAGVRILQPETVHMLTTKHSPFVGNDRALGWDLDSGYSIRGNLPPGSFGHTGFTGTSLWIDPTTHTFIILLTNVVHAQPVPRTVIRLRREVSNAVAAALTNAPLEPGPGPAAPLPSGK